MSQESSLDDIKYLKTLKNADGNPKFKKEFLDFLSKQKLQLTEKGKEVGKDVARKIDIAIKKAVQDLTDEDKACVYRSLKSISQNLEKIDFTNEKA